MPRLRRWLPLIGTAALVASAALKIAGYPEAAQAIDTLGGIAGITSLPELPVGEIAAIAAAGTGIVLKVRSQIAKARGGEQ